MGAGGDRDGHGPLLTSDPGGEATGPIHPWRTVPLAASPAAQLLDQLLRLAEPLVLLRHPRSASRQRAFKISDPARHVERSPLPAHPGSVAPNRLPELARTVVPPHAPRDDARHLKTMLLAPEPRSPGAPLR